METRTVDEIADDYFGYLGRHLPQQCASDEFYFLPRSEGAMGHLTHLDYMTPDAVADHIAAVSALLHELATTGDGDLEDEIDRDLVRQSMEGFIREFGTMQVWRSDPARYVTIPLLATDHIISGTCATPEGMTGDLLAVFSQIPPFLGRAAAHLRRPAGLAIEVACAMVDDALQFYERDLRTFIAQSLAGNRELLASIDGIRYAWETYRHALRKMPACPSFAIGKENLEAIFGISLGCEHSIDAMLEIARHEYDRAEQALRRLAAEMDGTTPWQDLIYTGSCPPITTSDALVQLYDREIDALHTFFRTRDILTLPPGERVALMETPSFLRSLRATASYRAPLTGDSGGRGIFYITPGDEDLTQTAAHCPYLTAHEAYPGHHVLDHVRLDHPNAIRRQIESPLFYEGWACYAEHLLDDLGYITRRRTRMIGLKRRLWRALRTELDIMLQTERITLAEGAAQIEDLGFTPRRAARQIRRFALTPGYQSCYALGLHEILDLRRRFSGSLTMKEFHDTLLSGGQIPFHWCRRRLQQAAAPLP